MDTRRTRSCGRLGLILILIRPSFLYGADKTILELQRQVMALGDQVNTLQTTVNGLQGTVNEKLGALGALVQQTLDRTNQLHTDNAVAASSLADQIRQEEQKIVAPLVALGAKVDQVASQVSAAQDNVTDVSTRLSRLEQRIVDLENAVKASQAPPSQPPVNSQTPGGPPAGVTAQGLFQAATRDQLAGNSDLALEEYQNYVKYFGDTDSAVMAQFHIGELLLKQGALDPAVQAFDSVVRQNSKSLLAPDALYQKAQALKRQGDRSSANQVLSQLVRQYPDSEAAGKARTELPAARPAGRK